MPKKTEELVTTNEMVAAETVPAFRILYSHNLCGRRYRNAGVR